MTELISCWGKCLGIMFLLTSMTLGLGAATLITCCCGDRWLQGSQLDVLQGIMLLAAVYGTAIVHGGICVYGVCHRSP